MPFGGGAYAPNGPMLDALQQELDRLRSHSTARGAVASLAHTILATAQHGNGGMTSRWMRQPSGQDSLLRSLWSHFDE